MGVWTGHGKNAYYGEWSNDKKEGRGTLQTETGKYEGHWKDDMVIKKRKKKKSETKEKEEKERKRNNIDNNNNKKKHGTGVYTTFIGTRYEGSWMYDQKIGKGSLTFTNGKSQKLTWRSDTLVADSMDSVAPEVPHLLRPGYTG